MFILAKLHPIESNITFQEFMNNKFTKHIHSANEMKDTNAAEL